MVSHRTTIVTSSPDPLADDNAPTVSTRPTPTRPRGRHLFSSPTKTITSHSTTTVSPWRIRVVFEAEHEDDLQLGSPSRAGPVRTRTKTTKVPVKGLESSPAVASTPKKRARSVSRPKKTPTAAAQVEEEEEEQVGTPKKKAPATRKKTPAAKPRSRKKKDDETAEKEIPPATLPRPATVRKTRAGSTPAVTLASTRARRQTRSSSAMPDDTENQGASAPLDATPSRNALGNKDSNSLLSPSPGPLKNNRNMQLISPNPTQRKSSSRSPSPPKRMRHEKSTTESFSISEGDTLSLPDFMSSSVAQGSLSSASHAQDQSEEDALADISRGWQAPTPKPAPHEHDFTYISNGTSFTPRRPGKSGLANEVHLSSSPPPVGVETFYGPSSHLHEQAQLDTENGQDEEMDESVSMLPDDLTGGSSDYHGYTGPLSETPAKPPRSTEYTHMDNGQSYTPRPPSKGAMDLDDDSDGISDAEYISPDTFYGEDEHMQPDIKGKGRAIDSSHGVVTPEESPKLSGPRHANHNPEPSLPPIITPSFTSTKTQTVNPAPRAPLISRDTPNIVRVVEASETMSDALEVDDPMRMEQERFGTTPAPPTPESRGRTPPRAPSPRVVIEVPVVAASKRSQNTKEQESFDDTYAAERHAVTQRAREVGAITIHDSSLISTDDSSFNNTSVFPASLQDTVAFEQSLLNLPQQSAHPTPSVGVDDPSLIVRPDPPTTLQWTKEEYSHLAAILKSKNTPPTKKRFLLQLHERDYWMFGGVEVVRELDVDEEGWLRLTARESAAVVRFRDREGRCGREWGVGEVVRRVSGMKVAGVKREVVGARR